MSDTRHSDYHSVSVSSVSISPELAREIAQKHLNKMNPDKWDGTGDRPASFDERICTYEIGSKLAELDVSFYFDEDADMWCHYCELREKDTEYLLQPISGYGVDSFLNLVDSIEDACQNVPVDSLKKYRIPVVWQMMGYQYIHASNIQEAIRIAGNMPLPDNGEYLEDSFEIDIEGLEQYQESEKAGIAELADVALSVGGLEHDFAIQEKSEKEPR